MKKILFVTATAMLCFISCNNDSSTSATAAKNPDAERNKAKSRLVYKAMETGDVSGLDSIIDKDILDHAGEMGDIRGLDTLKKMFVEMHGCFSDLKWEVIAEAAEGDYLFTLARMTGTTNDHPSMGMPPNTKMDMKWVDMVKIKDGKAVEHWGYMDPKDMMKMAEMHKGMQPMNDKTGKMDKMKDTSMKK